MEFENDVQDKLKKIFKDFTPTDCSFENLLDDSTRISISRDDFPVERILLFMLHKVCQFSLIPRWDKMHWGMIFKYKEVIHLISSNKFGLRMYSQKIDGIEKQQVEILQKLKKNIKFVEKNILAKSAEEQIITNNFTIQNNFYKLNGQYFYFRTQAQELFKKEAIHDEEGKDLSKIFNTYYKKREFENYAVYNSLAMIDSYFSRLEHILVLALPFTKLEKSYDFKIFIGDLWSKKYIEVLGLEGEAKIRYEELKSIKERYRNTFAHGGFEKKSQSFHFHLQNYGAVPATMSDYKNSVHFNSTPLNEKKFEKICKVLDSVDELFRKNLPTAWMFCSSGLDLIMDNRSLSHMLEEAQDLDNFENWLEMKNQRLCDYINTDY